MFLPEQLPALARQIREQAARDFRLLEDLVAQAREMAPGVRPISPRAATSVALTAADGGNHTVAFNPFSLQIIRVVDSAGKELLAMSLAGIFDRGTPCFVPVPAIFGHLQADAAAGFPVPFYPFSLQQADAHSRVADLDVEIISDSLVSAVRDLVGHDKAHIVDALRLATDVAARRYA